MATALTPEAIAAVARRATKDKHVVVTVRRGGDPTTMMTVEGVVTENLGDSFRFHPEGAEKAETTALVPDGKAGTEYIEIKIKNAESHHDVDIFSMKRSTIPSNLLGITEFDPRSWVRVLVNTPREQLPIVQTMIMTALDHFFSTGPRIPGSYGTLPANEEEKQIHRDAIQSFLRIASLVQMHEALYDMIMHPVLRLCALRRAQTTDGEKRKKILAKAHHVWMLPDPKKRDEEWIKYNNEVAGADLN